MHFCWDPSTETRVHWEKKGEKGRKREENVWGKVIKN